MVELSMLNVLCSAVYSVTVVEGFVEPELCQLLGDDMTRLLQPWLSTELTGYDWASAFEVASYDAQPGRRKEVIKRMKACLGTLRDAERQDFIAVVSQLLQETARAFGSPDPGARKHLRDLLAALEA